jgi:hypothetical protein
MIIGITGTRNGFTNAQKNAFQSEFLTLYAEGVDEFHQGQCVGVDVQSADWIHKRTKGKVKIHSRPPVKQELVGVCHVDVTHPKKSYFARNRDIVNSSDILFACTPTEEEQSNGGTWYTFRYAVDNGKKVILITPSGTISKFNF